MPEPDTSSLLTVQQAIRILDSIAVRPRTMRIPLAAALGRRLAQPLKTDRDYPPFDKSLMDGYAVRAADMAVLPAELRVVGEIPAGTWPGRAIGSGETMAIMTGAPLPVGADGVALIEDVEKIGPDTIRIIRGEGPKRFAGRRGSDCAAGQVVLAPGARMGPAQIAVAAAIGAGEIDVFAPPRAAVLATGDELSPINGEPGESQIRNSNSPMLVALLQTMGCEVADLGAVGDKPELIRDALRRGLAHDALFVTGGMSMGEYDFVPKLLQELGVDLKITKLRIKPGKPFVFGTFTGGEGSGFGVQGSEAGVQGSGFGVQDSGVQGSGLSHPRSSILNQQSAISNVFPLSASPRPRVPASSPAAPACAVFGLPGNPVSAFVCTIRLASRLIGRLSGAGIEERWVSGRLEVGMGANGPREFYQPAIRTLAPGRDSTHGEFASITPLKWLGSADLFTLARANVLLVRPELDPALPRGTVVRVLEI